MGTQPAADRLEEADNKAHRTYELCGMGLTVATGLGLCARLIAGGPMPMWWAPFAVALGMLGADLVSGLVHWGFDTWGALDTPVVGRLAIRAFRHHHIDPTAMLHHDFVETNGHNITLSLTLTVGGLSLVPAAHASQGARFGGLFLVVMAVFVSFTSQIHKWAHTPNPPWFVRTLQRLGLLLSPEHHVAHHEAPHVRNYCTTVGWVDHVFFASRFFERLERLVGRVFGATPLSALIRKRGNLTIPLLAA